MWNIVPENIKTLTSLEYFNKNIKKWESNECPRKLCRLYLPNIGYI